MRTGKRPLSDDAFRVYTTCKTIAEPVIATMRSRFRVAGADAEFIYWQSAENTVMQVLDNGLDLPDEKAVLRYVMRCIRNAALAHHAEYSLPSIEELTAAVAFCGGIPHELMLQELREQVERELQKYGEDDRTMFRLRQAGVTLRVVGNMTNSSESTVSRRVAQIRAELYDALADDLGAAD